MDRQLHLAGPNRDDDADLYEIRADGDVSVLGLIVQGSTLEIVYWPGNGVDGRSLGIIDIPPA